MGNPTKDAPVKPAQTNPLKALASDAVAQAVTVERKSSGEVKAGPFEVGGAGNVSVIERTIGGGDKKYLFAEYVPTGGGKAKSIPLAACAVLAEQMA